MIHADDTPLPQLGRLAIRDADVNPALLVHLVKSRSDGVSCSQKAAKPIRVLEFSYYEEGDRKLYNVYRRVLDDILGSIQGFQLTLRAKDFEPFHRV
jgi:hypothetical protein